MPQNIKKILIGEDEKPMAKAMQLKLNSTGFDAKTAQNGEEVLNMMSDEDFDLVLLDLIMPKVDGFKVLEELNKRGNKTPIIVSSNLSSEEDKERAVKLGAKDYFIKSNTPISEVVNYAKKALGLEK